MQEIENSTPKNIDILDVVKNWKVDAYEEDMSRYFFEFEGFDGIVNGDYVIVLGRKGCGKSAIINYIESIQDETLIAKKITFGEFPFEEFSELLKNEFMQANSFSLAWKFAIYSSILDGMAVTDTLSGEARKILDERKPISAEQRLKETVTRWRSRAFSFGVSHPVTGGATFSTGSQPIVKKPPTLIDQVSAMEDFIISNIDKTRYFILFDGLDSQVPRPEHSGTSWNTYGTIISALCRACLEVRGTFRKLSANVIPMVFIRDDIFELTEDSDKEKWSDHTLELSWRIDQIRSLLAHRISRAVSPTANTLSFERAWNLLFYPKTKVTVNRDRSAPIEIEILQYIRLRTFLRPRDFIRYLQICAKVSTTQGNHKGRIRPDIIINSELNYSKRFIQELMDELLVHLPQFKYIVPVFDKIGTRSFTYENFVEALEADQNDGVIPKIDMKPHIILHILFKYSIIGNTRRFRENGETIYYRTFKYTKPYASLDLKRKMTVHSGLYMAMYSTQAELYSSMANDIVEDTLEPTSGMLFHEE